MDFTTPGLMPYESNPYSQTPYGYGEEYMTAYGCIKTIYLIVFIAFAISVILTALTYIRHKSSVGRLKQYTFRTRIADMMDFEKFYLKDILKCLYLFSIYMVIISCIFLIVYSFFSRYFGSEIRDICIPLIIFGPVAIRILFEILIMAVAGFEKLVSIEKKLGEIQQEECDSLNEDNNKANAVNADVISVSVQGESETDKTNMPLCCYCTVCGTKYDASAGPCPNGCSD